LKGTFTMDESAPNTKAQSSGVMANATGTVDADLSKLVASDITVNHHVETPPTKEQPAGMKMDRTATIEAK